MSGAFSGSDDDGDVAMLGADPKGKGKSMARPRMDLETDDCVYDKKLRTGSKAKGLTRFFFYNIKYFELVQRCNEIYTNDKSKDEDNCILENNRTTC